MMTIGEAIYAVREELPVSSDDSGVSKRFIYSRLQAVRSELMKQELDKNRLRDGNSAQVLPCIPTMLVDSVECGYRRSGKLLHKSIDPLPDTLASADGLAIFGIYTPNGKKLKLTTYSDWAKVPNRYTLPDSVSVFIKNNHLFIDGFLDFAKYEIMVEGLFNNPIQVGKLLDCYNGSGGSACKSVLDYEFHLPGYLERRIVLIVVDELRSRMGVPEDRENNSKSDTNVQNQNMVRQKGAV